MSHIQNILEGVNTDLSAMSLDITSLVSYLPIYNLEDVEKLIVITPKNCAMVPNSRNTDAQTFQVDIALLAQVSDVSTEVPEYLGVLESIYKKFRRNRLSTYTSAICNGAEQSNIYDAIRLEKENLFLGVLTLRFQITD